jgi:flagellar motor switch protein FliG
LSGIQKAAVLLIILGPEVSSLVLKQLPHDDVEQISTAIANTHSVEPAVKKQVIDEFLDLSEAHQYIIHGGIRYAREVLERTYGPQKANEMIKKLSESSQVRPFAMIRKTDPKQLFNFIINEHPQTIALILSYLEAEQASVILSSLPQELQSDIARRVATMERTSPEIVREIEAVLERKLSSLVSQDFTTVGGIKTLVDILNRVDRGTEKTILESLEMGDPELVEEIHKRMFVFEDVIVLDNNSIRRVLREIDMRDLAHALKGSSEEVKDRVFKNMSQRAGEMLKEDMEMMGPVRIRDVEAAQQKIVQVIRHLDEIGEIIISRGGEDALIM